MKKIFWLGLTLFLAFNTTAQVYNLETIYKYQSTFYLSHWQVVENPTDTIQYDTFSLWGNHSYGESWVDNAYEVEYFKGNAKETYRFLDETIHFAKKYKLKNNYVTYIQGVKIKAGYFWKTSVLLIYDNEEKVAAVTDEKMLATMFNNFIQYCRKNNIDYQ